jgi:hypothetical protein
MASSVRIGSTGNGRPARVRIASVTLTMWQRRANFWRVSSAARCCWTVTLPARCARRTARLVSAIVRVDVIRRPGARIEAFAAMSPSITAATRALDSMYRQAGAAAADERPAGVRRCGTALRFATVAVNQGGCRAGRKPNLRAVFHRVTVLNGWRNRAGGHEQVDLANSAAAAGGWRNKLGDNPPVSGNYDTLSRLDSPDVPAKVVLQFSYAGLHVSSIAICGHIVSASAGYGVPAFARALVEPGPFRGALSNLQYAVLQKTLHALPVSRSSRPTASPPATVAPGGKRYGRRSAALPAAASGRRPTRKARANLSSDRGPAFRKPPDPPGRL